MAINGQQQCAGSVIARSECPGSGHQVLANLVADLAVVVAALHILAQWTDGPEVSNGFDEPKAALFYYDENNPKSKTAAENAAKAAKAALIARAVLAAIGIDGGLHQGVGTFDPWCVVAAIGGISSIGGGR